MTLHCKVDHQTATLGKNGEDLPAQAEHFQGEYWFSADALRATITHREVVTDMFWKGSICRAVIRKNLRAGPGVAATVSSQASRHFSRCDPFDLGLLAINRPGSSQVVYLEDLVKIAADARHAGTVQEDGRMLEHLRIKLDATKDAGAESPAWDLDLYLDPATGYLIRRAVYRARGAGMDGYERHIAVTSFADGGNGLFFPQACAGYSQVNGSKDFRHATKVTDLQLNPQIDARRFQLTFPHNVLVTDAVKSATYHVDSAGNPITTPVSFRAGPPPPQNLPENISAYHTETSDVRRPGYTVAVLAVVTLVMIAAYVLVIRKIVLTRLDTEG